MARSGAIWKRFVHLHTHKISVLRSCRFLLPKQKKLFVGWAFLNCFRLRARTLLFSPEPTTAFSVISQASTFSFRLSLRYQLRSRQTDSTASAQPQQQSGDLVAEVGDNFRLLRLNAVLSVGVFATLKQQVSTHCAERGELLERVFRDVLRYLRSLELSCAQSVRREITIAQEADLQEKLRAAEAEVLKVRRICFVARNFLL